MLRQFLVFSLSFVDERRTLIELTALDHLGPQTEDRTWGPGS